MRCCSEPAACALYPFTTRLPNPCRSNLRILAAGGDGTVTWILKTIRDLQVRVRGPAACAAHSQAQPRVPRGRAAHVPPHARHTRTTGLALLSCAAGPATRGGRHAAGHRQRPGPLLWLGQRVPGALDRGALGATGAAWGGTAKEKGEKRGCRCCCSVCRLPASTRPSAHTLRPRTPLSSSSLSCPPPCSCTPLSSGTATPACGTWTPGASASACQTPRSSQSCRTRCSRRRTT